MLIEDLSKYAITENELNLCNEIAINENTDIFKLLSFRTVYCVYWNISKKKYVTKKFIPIKGECSNISLWNNTYYTICNDDMFFDLENEAYEKCKDLNEPKNELKENPNALKQLWSVVISSNNPQKNQSTVVISFLSENEAVKKYKELLQIDKNDNSKIVQEIEGENKFCYNTINKDGQILRYEVVSSIMLLQV